MLHEDFEDGDVELKDGYLEYQAMLELQAQDQDYHEWAVSCPDCGNFKQAHKNKPIVCLICLNPNVKSTKIKSQLGSTSEGVQEGLGQRALPTNNTARMVPFFQRITCANKGAWSYLTQPLLNVF